MIDTHAHLDFPQFEKDREKVIEQAFSSGVKAIINIGIDLESSRKSIALADAYESIYATVGFHPHNASRWNEEALKELETLATHPKVVAIGEAGLDFYRNLSSEESQMKAFREQIELALRLNLPIVIHIRNAYKRGLEILSQYFIKREKSGILHCFSGDEEDAREALSLGFHLAFNGTLTYRNSKAAGVVKKLPLNSILIETDCPYLTPEPFRGRRNEPKLVKLVLEKMVELFPSSTFEELDQWTSRNARNVLGIK
ncbi:MAG: TatD family hydrolase [Acidobacteriota bacterium]